MLVSGPSVTRSAVEHRLARGVCEEELRLVPGDKAGYTEGRCLSGSELDAFVREGDKALAFGVVRREEGQGVEGGV